MPFFKTSSKSIVINALRILWVCLTVFYEIAIFRYSAASCSWPDTDLLEDNSHNVPKHVLLVADPQILDHRSYPGRPALLTYISQILVDLNLRKSWRAALGTKPDAVMFLGDMNDNGRMVMEQAEYERYIQRFMNIFSMDSDIPRYFIPGNHDVGLGHSPLFLPHARTRYTTHFGPLNNHVSIANYTFVMIDAPGLVEEDYRRHGQKKSYENWNPRPEGTIEFLKSFAAEGNTEPTILLSHIPLSRPEGSNCGPLRERGTIRRGVGLGYQNTLGKETSLFLLERLQPTLIFSGDDHDYCDYTHILDERRVREVTVKSLSMAMGISKPGYHLLSLIPPGGPTFTHSDVPCLMPNQVGIYLSVYIPLALFSLFVVLIYNIVRGQYYQRWSLRSLHSKKESNGSARSKHQRKPSRSRITTDEFGYTLDGDMDQTLPLPVSASVSQEPRRRIIDPFHSLTKKMCWKSKRGGFFSNFLCDVRDVTVFPLSTIFFISLWTFIDF
ncbi:Metallo-dependent phosphatase-like protein [Rhodocollybia butyracea]|uniref:Metallo-dependent phosphatase-like protein n=1 Tax=Rhodocollybia butyracea TaxID=206335 RepID=A0A9P5PCA1_9AGAR|nr:Metallo-dependent phosphatase-like protein [Rhodocollybia butyracea]